jgi:hypothetical protein
VNQPIERDPKLFGLWRETRPEYLNYPSIKDYMGGSDISHQEKEKIIDYLDNGNIVASTSRVGFPCVITGKRFDGSLSLRTDGIWSWYDDLSYYIKNFDVALPQNLLENIRKNNYVVPLLSG